MPSEVEFTDEFGAWFDGLSQAEQESVSYVVDLLEASGPVLKFPYCSGIKGSAFGHMRELRIQHAGRPLRVLYAFDPQRTALLLIGGDKTGDPQWYFSMVREADKLYKRHLQELDSEASRNNGEAYATFLEGHTGKDTGGAERGNT